MIEPTFQIGEIAVVKYGIATDTLKNLAGREGEIISTRDNHASGIYIITDSYRIRWVDTQTIGLCSHRFLMRKRPKEELSQHSFHELIQNLKDTPPCELNTPLTTSEPQEAESSQIYSINPPTNALDAWLSTTSNGSQSLRDLSPEEQEYLKKVWSLIKGE